MTTLRCLLLLSVGWLVSACGGGPEACDELQSYQEAKEGERLVVPDGLDELQSGKELSIPETGEPQRDPRGAGCLERPPGTYSSGSSDEG